MRLFKAIQRRFFSENPSELVGKVRSFEALIQKESSSSFLARMELVRRRYHSANGKQASVGRDLLLESTALASEAVSRTLGFRLHDVQIEAALAAAKGCVAEMQTGEGKTVVTGVISFLKSLQFPSVHVATTNAYLAERDRNSLAPFFNLLSTSSSVLPENNDPSATRAAYRKQVTYGPGYQFGFDFLKDQLTLRDAQASRLGMKTLQVLRRFDVKNQLLQPSPRHCMIIDEADSVMIDEAVIPMVLSGPSNEPLHAEVYLLARDLVEPLEMETDFRISQTHGTIELNEVTLRKLHHEIQHRSLKIQRPWETYLVNALKAKHLLKRDEHFIIHNGEVQIVDQMTGRVFPDRNWKDGLHQAVEAFSGVKITLVRDSIARITRQRFLQEYTNLCGLTGTAKQVESEFETVYGCPVQEIPPNLPCQRKQYPARFFQNQNAKRRAIVEETLSRHAAGQPLLIGTCTIRESEAIAELLHQQSIQATVLNGVQDEEEANIVANAGKPFAVTIATNMAGRGTDIKLPSESLLLGGLHVIASEFNFSKRVDRQLAGRAARQGQPGSVQFFACADDQLFAKHAPRLQTKMQRDSKPCGECQSDYSNEVEKIQATLELKKFESRQAMMNHDRWMDSIRTTFERSRKVS